MKKTLAAIALLAAAGLTLTACAGGTDGGATGTESSAVFNDADVDFAQQMIVHHEQAIEMAQLAEGRTSNEEILSLAADVEAAQGPEIETLQGWLEAWGEDGPADDDMGDMDMGQDSGGSMSGMMDEDQMDQLMAASGDDWDRMFLEMMIEHHKGAIEMAQVQVEQGENPDAVALAEKVISDQEAEITQMQEMLDS